MPQKTDGWTVPEGEFAIWGEARAHPEHADKVHLLYRELTRLSLADPTVIQYCLGRDPDDPALFHFYERYKSKKDYEDHCNWPIVKEFLATGWMKGFTAVFTEPIVPFADAQEFQNAGTGLEKKK